MRQGREMTAGAEDAAGERDDSRGGGGRRVGQEGDDSSG